MVFCGGASPPPYLMIPRYTRKEMGRVWSDQGRYERWLEVELAASDELAERGIVPLAAAEKLRERARIHADRINEIELKVKHDVIAFTLAVGETVADPSAARWLHYGLTSNDIVDTAQALQVREASRLIEHGLVRFGEVLERRAREFQHTPQIGRTHGVHAEPITFGLKMAIWFDQNRRNLIRFLEAARQMAVGKHSGAVGNAAHLGAEVEEANSARAEPGHRTHHLTGDQPRPPRAVHRRAGRSGRLARTDRSRNPPPPAHRSA